MCAENRSSLSASQAEINVPAGSQVAAALAEIVHQEMRQWNIGGVALALLENQRLVSAQAFGKARLNSLFRVGSISKLFNAVAVMQLVEAGKLDLDQPLPPELQPRNPFPDSPAITLRQLLCHRSGLPREPAVGGYFDSSQPGLAATVETIRHTGLIARPGQKTHYSNFAPALAGHLVERAAGEAFPDYQREHVLGPLGMADSAWARAGLPPERLLPAYMRIANGKGGWKRRRAPLFDLGTSPAGNLYSTIGDLARFASALLAGGASLVKPGTLQEMWRPQLTEENIGFGLGFVVGRFREHLTMGHNGAVYGYSSSLVLLPAEKLAVIVLANEDIVNGPVSRISEAAVSLLLQTRPAQDTPAPILSDPEDLAQFAGDYESESYWARLSVRNRELVGDISGQPTRFSPAGPLTFYAHSRIENAMPAAFSRSGPNAITGFSMGIQRFKKVTETNHLPAAWRGFLGCYGPPFIPLVVTERHGHLYAMTENMVDYRLKPLDDNTFVLPPGLYAEERVVFLPGPAGAPHSVLFAGMLLRRND